MKNRLILLSLLGMLVHANENTTSGYVKSDLKYTHKLREIEYNSEGVKTEKIEKPLVKNTNFVLDAGLYLYQDKNLYVYGGVETQNKKEENKKDNKYQNYYFGARLDAPLSDKFDLVLNVAHKKGYVVNKKLVEKENGKNKIKKVESKKVFENAINEHLKVKDRNFDLKENGYELDVDKNTLISVVLNGKVNRKTNMILGSIYTSDNMKFGTHKYQGFIKTTGKVNNKTFLKTENLYTVDKDNVEMFGGILSKYNVDTKLSNKQSLSNEISFEAKKLSKINNFEFKSLNEYKNSEIDNLSLTTNVDYIALVDARQGGDYEHKPQIKLMGEYKFGNTKVISDISDKVEIKHNFQTKPVISKFKNTFNTGISIVNNVDNFGKKLEAKYKLVSEDLQNESSNHKLTHELLVGQSFWYKNSDRKHSLDLRYNMKFDEKFDNSIFVIISNEKKYTIDNNNIDLKLDLYNYTNFDTKETKIQGKIFNAFLLDSNMKFTNTTGKLKSTLFSELQYYNLFKEKGNAKGENNVVNSVLSKLNLELRYAASRKVDTVFNLNNTYGYNFLQQEYYRVTRDFIKNFGAGKYKDSEYSAIDNYAKTLDASRQDSYVATLSNVDKVESEINTLHSLRMSPKFSVVIKELDGRLQLIPYIEGILDFKNYKYNSASYAKELKEKKAELDKAPNGTKERKEKLDIYRAAIKDTEANKKFNFRNFEGRIGINVKYSW
ncbi:hypothetical protein HP397_05445 [Streptobacillus felis]|uniref:Uncharacterized protein n=1 Tax=Streptobacillus felis TaxID=1384509 RepID=A0A7Z0T8S6_9FUSO|nr:hypothetical protein [Streptobacillus felis]NYV28249.1 hypothetical protein [Streptobacillus felis]